MQPLRGSGQIYFTCGFSPDGRFFAAGGTGHAVELWDLADPDRPPGRVETGDSAVVHTGFTPDGRVVVVPARGSVHLFFPEIGMGTVTDHERPFWARRGALSADGRLVTAGDRLQIWHLSADGFTPAWDQLPAIGQTFGGVAFSPDGDRIATSRLQLHPPSWIEVWDTNTGLNVARPMVQGRLDKLSWSPDGWFLAGLVDRHVTVWETGTWREVVGPPENAGPGRRLSLLFHPTGKQLLTGNSSGEVTLWDVATWRPLTTFRWGTGPVYALAFAPDGLRAAAAGHTGVVLWDLDV
jgi:WD40 repeat protein